MGAVLKGNNNKHKMVRISGFSVREDRVRGGSVGRAGPVASS